MDDPDHLLRAKLNAETAQIPWQTLQRFFAQGVVLQVADGLDLVEVALALTRDERSAVDGWLQRNQLCRVPDAQARRWIETDASVWCVVVKPWLLVQDLQGHAHR